MNNDLEEILGVFVSFFFFFFFFFFFVIIMILLYFLKITIFILFMSQNFLEDLEALDPIQKLREM